MKNIVKSLGLVSLAILAGCSSEEPQTENNQFKGEVKPIELSSKESQVAVAMNDFQYNFFKQKLECSNPDENIIVSPLSARILLSFLANGTDEEGQREIAQVLNCSDISTVNSLTGKIITQLPVVDPAAVNLSLAQSVWYDSKFTLSQSFKSISDDVYFADLFPRNMTDGNSLLSEVNDWCSDKTNGMIPNFLSYWIPANALMFNALYFNGTWAHKFDVAKTDKSVFHGSVKNGTVDMMHNVLSGGAEIGDNYQAVKINFGNAQAQAGFSITFVAPLEGFTISDVEQSFKQTSIDAYATTEINLSLPRFELKASTQDISQELANMGITHIFNNHKQTLFNEDWETAWTILQGASIKIDETGAELAATTMAGQYISYIPETTTMVLDRPFLFFVNETSTGVCLMAGRVMNLGI